jgi:hypothetical protein
MFVITSIFFAILLVLGMVDFQTTWGKVLVAVGGSGIFCFGVSYCWGTQSDSASEVRADINNNVKKALSLRAGCPSGLPVDVSAWTVSQVSAWLTWVGLKEYVSKFEDEDISGVVLVSLTVNDLSELGIADENDRLTIVNRLFALKPQVAQV